MLETISNFQQFYLDGNMYYLLVATDYIGFYKKKKIKNQNENPHHFQVAVFCFHKMFVSIEENNAYQTTTPPGTVQRCSLCMQGTLSTVYTSVNVKTHRNTERQ